MGYKYYMITLGCTPQDRSAFHTTRFLHHRIFRGFGERSEPTHFVGVFTAAFCTARFSRFLASGASRPFLRVFHGRDFPRPRFCGVFFTAAIFTAAIFRGFWRAKRANPYLRDFYGRDLRPRFSAGFWCGRLVSCHISGVFGRHDRWHAIPGGF